MDNNFVATILLPFALSMVMFRVGLSLELEYLQRAIKNKKPIIIGLFSQLILLPIFGFSMLYFFDFPYEMEMGILIISLCPGGWISNLLSTKLRADVNLSIALTTFSSLVGVITIPFYLYLALFFFYPIHATDFDMAMMTGKISLWVVIPAVTGLIIHYKNMELAAKILRFIQPTSIILIVFIVIGAAITEGEHFAEYFRKIGILLFFLNVISMLLSYYISNLFKCRINQAITISIETGVQNSTLAIVVAMSIMGNLFMAIPPTIYTLIMFGTVSFLLFFRKQQDK